MAKNEGRKGKSKVWEVASNCDGVTTEQKQKKQVKRRGRKTKKNLKSIGVRDGMGGQGQYRWAGAVTPVPQLSLLIYLEIAPLPEQLNGN